MVSTKFPCVWDPLYWFGRCFNDCTFKTKTQNLKTKSQKSTPKGGFCVHLKKCPIFTFSKRSMHMGLLCIHVVFNFLVQRGRDYLCKSTHATQYPLSLLQLPTTRHKASVEGDLVGQLPLWLQLQDKLLNIWSLLSVLKSYYKFTEGCLPTGFQKRRSLLKIQ